MHKPGLNPISRENAIKNPLGMIGKNWIWILD